jgi:hypothetical protein
MIFIGLGVGVHSSTQKGKINTRQAAEAGPIIF